MTTTDTGPTMRPNRIAGIHPLFLGAYPVLFLWSQNVGETDVSEVIAPLLITVAISLVATVGLTLLLRDIRRAALIVSSIVVVVLMYGHITAILSETAIPARAQKVGLAGVVGLAIVAAARLSPRAIARVDAAVTRVSIILVAVSLASIVAYQAPTVAQGRPTMRPGEPTYSTTTTAPKRDVYYLVFDRYGSDEALRLRYDHVNALTPWLKEQGFTVLDDSHANYVRTGLSLPTTLNMIHANELAAAMGPTNTDQRPFREAIASSIVAKQFKALGYTYHHLGTWWGPTAVDPLADVNYRLNTATDFDLVLYETSALPLVMSRLGVDEPTVSRVNYGNGIYQMDTLDDLVEVDGPKFVFAHVLLPHPPLVFDRDGSFLAGKAARGLTEDERWERQLDYTNQRLMAFFERILALPVDRQPIIIFQADEGPYPVRYSAERETFDWSTASADEIEMKFGVMNAWYLPGGEDLGLDPSTTLINTFPTLFTNYFGLDYERLPDTIQASRGWLVPYDLIDITERVPHIQP